MNIITGYRGEAHITSAQDRGKNQGAFGVDSYILNVGDKLAADIVSANEIRIRDGVLSMQGCVASIDEGAYDSCEISNGTQGMQRRDLIVARYTRNVETNIEDISLVVIEGTPASSSPADPAYNSGDIQAGDSPVDFPLYRVNINGVNISGTTKLASSVRTQAETDTLLGSTSISGIGNGTVTGALSILNGKTAELVAFRRANIANNATDSVSIANSNKGLLIVSGGGLTGRGVYIVYCSSTGGVAKTDVLAASGVALNLNTANRITFTNTSGAYISALLIEFA